MILVFTRSSLLPTLDQLAVLVQSGTKTGSRERALFVAQKSVSICKHYDL